MKIFSYFEFGGNETVTVTSVRFLAPCSHC